jgi:hypothetical protein
MPEVCGAEVLRTPRDRVWGFIEDLFPERRLRN